MLDILVLVFFVLLAIFCIMYKNTQLRKQKSLIAELTKWHEIALTDDLTRLPNRAAYSNYIHSLNVAKGISDMNLSVIIFDIDNFKQINDTYGHLAGDKVLQKCAQILQEVFNKPESTVYRIGGDEFAIISQNIKENDLIDMLLNVREIENDGLDFKLSKGYSMSYGRKDFYDMFKRADEMLYDDKMSKKYKI